MLACLLALKKKKKKAVMVGGGEVWVPCDKPLLIIPPVILTGSWPGRNHRPHCAVEETEARETQGRAALEH